MKIRQREILVGEKAGCKSSFFASSFEPGDTCRLMLTFGSSDPTDDLVELTVGPRDDPHWVQLHIPASSLGELAAVFAEEAAKWEALQERLAIQAEGRSDDESDRSLE